MNSKHQVREVPSPKSKYTKGRCHGIGLKISQKKLSDIFTKNLNLK